MKKTFFCLVFVLLAILAGSGVLPAGDAAQTAVTQTFVRLGSGVPGVLYSPKHAASAGGIGILVMHPGGDYLEFSAGPELALRGFHVLCANTSAAKSGISNDVGIEQLISEVGLGVEYLRSLDEIQTVVLFGHSGGGALMAAYQNTAENGTAAGRGPEKLIPLPDRMKAPPPADGLLLIGSNYGLGCMVLFSLDPAVTDETGGAPRNPELDLFRPENGFSAAGASYGPAFTAAFQAGIAWRMTRLIETAQTRLAAIEAGNGRFGDDEPLIIPEAVSLGSSNKFFAQDPSFLSRTSQPRLLLRGDGSRETRIVSSVRKPKNTRPQTGLLRGALVTTVRTFLSTYAVRVGPDFSCGADSLQGIAWRSSLTSPVGSVQTVTVPLLAMGMTGNWEFLAAELLYEHAASADKSLAFVEGAAHVFTVGTECEAEPGEFGDTVRTTYDNIAEWLREPGRFLPAHQ